MSEETAAVVGNCQVRVVIRAGEVLDLTDISQYTSGQSVENEDRSLRTFLSLLLSQLPVQT